MGFRAPTLLFLSECSPLGPVLIYRQLPSDWYWKRNYLKWLTQNTHISHKLEKGLRTPTLLCAIHALMYNMHVNITCNSWFWIHTYHICSDWTIQSKVTTVYIFRIDRGISNPHALFFFWMPSSRTSIDLQTITFKLVLKKKLFHLFEMTGVRSTYFSNETRGFRTPHASFCYLNAFPSDQHWFRDHYFQIGTEKTKLMHLLKITGAKYTYFA